MNRELLRALPGLASSCVRPSRSLAASVVLVAMVATPLALAQTSAKPKKKGAKPAASASASDTAVDTPPPAPTPPPDPAPASTSAAGDEGASATPKSELPATPPEAAADSSNTYEDPLKSYAFIGLRYRGTVIPQFLINAFVNGGGTFYSNMIGAELDIRKDGHSTMPWIAFANYGFGNTVFESDSASGGKDIPGNWTVVNSSLNALYLGLDELWSVPLDKEQHHWDFEYGFGVGLGVVFGNLMNNWVTPINQGAPISQTNYKECQTVNDGPGCAPTDHNNATTDKVGGYQEKAGLLGPKPILFPYLAVPQLGVRYKPIKQLQTRLGVGFSLTGFFFNLSVDYGLEKTGGSTGGTAANTGTGPLVRHDML